MRAAAHCIELVSDLIDRTMTSSSISADGRVFGFALPSSRTLPRY
jgi:hypothetical protein